MDNQTRNLLLAILGVLISPIAAAIEHGISLHLLITTILYFIVPLIGGCLYFFWSVGADICWDIITFFLPFITVYTCTKDWVLTIICVVLWLFGWLPGAIMGFYFLLNGPGNG